MNLRKVLYFMQALCGLCVREWGSPIVLNGEQPSFLFSCVRVGMHMSNEAQFTSEEKMIILTAIVGAAFWIPLWYLGVSWWKAPLVGMLAAMIYRIGWGARAMPHAAVALIALATAVWIEALPPPSQWKVSANSIAVALQR
jgi:hypothetical protein